MERSYPGTADQARYVRADLAVICAGFPAAESLVLLTSELVTNAIVHSRSGRPGGSFTVRVLLYLGDYAWIEVVDEGGAWAGGKRDDEASRVAWFRLGWRQDRP